MPQAIVNISDTETFKLRSCPGGEVVLRRMTYGQKLSRQQSSMKTTVEQQKGSRAGKMNLDMLQHAATIFDFRACVVDHNLTDEKEQKLNLTNPVDIDRLDPRVGEEIAKLIDEMNNFEDALEDGDFPSGSELP